jgi:lysophospholipase L1-like esterase
MNTRRDFIKNAALCGAVFGLPVMSAAAPKPAPKEATADGKIELSKGDTILFQGDSVTDARRSRGRSAATPNDPSALGFGYATLAASTLLDKYAEKDLKIFNRGISGHKVPDLLNRWQKDTLDLKPNVLSILIGVNDFWHVKTHGYTGTLGSFEKDYRELLKRTVAALPKTKIVLGEPFAINVGKAVNDSWFPEFDAFRAVVKKLSGEFKTVFVPFQSVFDEAAKRAPKAYWSADGVHPTFAGVHLMAEAWIAAVK